MNESNAADTLGSDGLTPRLPRRVVVVWLVLILGVLMAHQARYVVQGYWGTGRGYEYKDIALSLAQGHGFSFSPDARWLFQDQWGQWEDPQHAATSWKEPIYVGWMAAWYALLGEEAGGIAIHLGQVLILIGTCWLTYRLGARIFGDATGLVAASLLALSPLSTKVANFALHTQPAGALLMCVLLLLLLGCLDRPTVKRAVVLGVALGLSALTLASLLLSSLVIALALTLKAIRERSRPPIVAVLIVAAVSAAVISPWTVRNYWVTGHFIPIQTGLGNFAYYSNVNLAETYRDDLDLAPQGSGPPWTSRGPIDALRTMPKGNYNTQLILRSIDNITASAPEGWADYTEHERDKVYLQRFKAFAAEHPGDVLTLSAGKAALLYLFTPMVYLPVSLLALVGMALAWRTPRAWILPSAALATTMILFVTAPVYYRYRFPIEPIIMLFAAFAMVQTARWVLAKRSASA